MCVCLCVQSICLQLYTSFIRLVLFLVKQNRVLLCLRYLVFVIQSLVLIEFFVNNALGFLIICLLINIFVSLL